MYYLQSPFFYHMQGQVYMFPPMMQSNMIFPDCIEKKQFNTQELSQQKKSQNLNVDVDSLEKQNLTTLTRPVQSKHQRETVDSDYEPEKNELMIFYKTKNTESNLSNQIYSFISSPKSMTLMQKVFDGNLEKVEGLYKLIKKIKKTNKKYMNRAYIQQMILLKEDGTNFKIFKRSKSILTAQEIRKALRISFRYFMANVCDSGLLTSKKMNKSTLMEHFARKREIVFYMKSGNLGEGQEED